jgi:hypothetical protein
VPRLNDTAPIGDETMHRIEGRRTTEMPALAAAVKLLADTEFKDRATLLPVLARAIEMVTRRQAETRTALNQPKPARQVFHG